MTSFDEFKSLSRHGNVIPLHETLLADTETPVSIYLKLRRESRYSFLLESVEGGEKIGRYSFIGYNPFMGFRVKGDSYVVDAFHEDVAVLPTLVSPDDAPLEALKKMFAHIRTVRVPGLPRFSGGAVGYFGYESARLVERIPVRGEDELDIPDIFLLFYDVVLVFDNLKHQLHLVSNAYVSADRCSDHDLRNEYEKAAIEITKLKTILEKSESTRLGHARRSGDMQVGLTESGYGEIVRRAKEYIVEGDIFQVVLSQRLKQQAEVAPFDLYRTLRAVNPSPYMYYLDCETFQIIGSSPELLVRVEEGTVETRPIAGTRRRGGTEEEDRRLEQELLNDQKERAEHLMLVDLGRNDLGRICEFGSVHVTQFMEIERYSHVMHIVSNVKGKLRRDISPIDALYSCFPAGTLSGAPKIRAMEIIAELEPVQRGVYGGAIAYVDFSGNLDSCIAIRTIVVKDRTLYFQAGAGVVYDSNPRREYEETLEKLRANLKAFEMLLER
jgi:anthranilate synthase component 1